jgi:hypothetical protein
LASDSVQIILVLEKGRAEVTGKPCLLAIIGLMIVFVRIAHSQNDATQITKWQYGKTGAVSLTYDDGSINQFRIAVPIMDSLNFPATFFIITGEIPGSRYHGTFIGRPKKDIIQETATMPTNPDNFFERASAIGFLGYDGTLEYHTQAGEIYDEGNSAENTQKAYKIIDEAYSSPIAMNANEATAEQAGASTNEQPVFTLYVEP